MSAEESTPLEPADNTSDAELTDVNTSENSELEVENPEAETEENPVAEPEQPKSEPETPEEKLIFGKFKDLEAAEAAYKEAERAIREKAEYEKQLAAYRDNEEKARLARETEAKQMGFESAEARQINLEVKNFEFLRYAEALASGAAGADYDAAYEALTRYQNSLNPDDLAEAKKFFDPEAIEKVASATALYRNQKASEYQASQKERLFSETKNKLEAFAEETGDWLDVEERGSIVAEAINLAGPNADLKRVKELIDKVETKAIERFQAKQKAEQENKAQIEKLQSPGGGSPVVKEKPLDWHELSEEDLGKEVDKFFEEQNK